MTFSMAPFTRFPNELYDAICSAFTLRQLRVMLAVVRYTYGYGKEAAEIPIQKICKLSGISSDHAYRARAELIAMNVLKLNGRLLTINRNLKEWATADLAVTESQDGIQAGITKSKTRKTREKSTTSLQVATAKSALNDEQTNCQIGSKTTAKSALNELPNRQLHQNAPSGVVGENTSGNQSVSPETAEISEPDSISYINNLYLLSLKKNLKIDDDRYLLKKAANAVQESSSSKNFLEKDKLPKAAQALLDVWNAAFPDRKIPSLIPTPRFALLTEVTEFLQSVAGTEPWPESAEIQHLEWWLEDVLEYAKQQPYTSKASFDWIFQPQYLTRLVEGAYAPRCQ